MPELPLRPVRSPTKGLVTSEHDPALWRTAALRYRDHLSKGGGVFYVGIPPRPGTREAKEWIWRTDSEISALPPASFRCKSQGVGNNVAFDLVVTERTHFSIAHFDGKTRWQERPNDPRDGVESMSWPQAATALLAPERLIHGWEPQWNRTAPATVAGRPGTRVPLVLTLPWSDPRSYGDSLQPHWMHIDAEEAEVVIDDERGVILEWNGLVDGQVFERNAFTAIDFDIPLTEGDFDPAAIGLTNHRP